MVQQKSVPSTCKTGTGTGTVRGICGWVSERALAMGVMAYPFSRQSNGIVRDSIGL